MVGYSHLKDSGQSGVNPVKKIKTNNVLAVSVLFKSPTTHVDHWVPWTKIFRKALYIPKFPFYKGMTICKNSWALTP